MDAQKHQEKLEIFHFIRQYLPAANQLHRAEQLFLQKLSLALQLPPSPQELIKPFEDKLIPETERRTQGWYKLKEMLYREGISKAETRRLCKEAALRIGINLFAVQELTRNENSQVLV